jgi:deoxyribonuclease V
VYPEKRVCYNFAMSPGYKAWPFDMAGARRIQERVRREIRIEPLTKKVRLVAGVDAAFSGERVIGTASLFRYPEMIPVEDTHVVRKVSFPYVPGFLFFREGPALIDALRVLGTAPDLVLLDGQGIAHPEGAGLASHVGVMIDIPTIGCAKSRLVGEYEEPGTGRGQWSPLLFKGQSVGAVVRTQHGLRPLFVSPGHRITPGESVLIALGCAIRYRIPEPLRRADILSRRMKKALEGGKGGAAMLSNASPVP